MNRRKEGVVIATVYCGGVDKARKWVEGGWSPMKGQTRVIRMVRIVKKNLALCSEPVCIPNHST